VNLIAFNPVPERGFRRPEPSRVEAFYQVLQERGVSVTVRRELAAILRLLWSAQAEGAQKKDVESMTGLWEKLVNRFRHARYRQQQKTLPQTIWLHLVAALEESGKGMALRPNLYQVMIPASDYDLLRPLIADLEVELAGRLATEALKRGYHLTGAAGVRLLSGR